jgi:hypothetical protein
VALKAFIGVFMGGYIAPKVNDRQYNNGVSRIEKMTSIRSLAFEARMLIEMGPVARHHCSDRC